MFNLFHVMETPELLSAEMIDKIDKATESYLKDTPKKLRELRDMRIPSSIKRPMTKQDLANLTGVGAQNVGKIEKEYGEAHSLNASIKYLIKIAVIFDVDLNYLVGLTQVPKRLYNVNGPKPSKKLDDKKLSALIDTQEKILEILKS